MAEHNLNASEGGAGGDVVFAPGAGCNAPDGSFVFKTAAGTEWIRLAPDGFYLRGEKQADDRLLYLEFKRWFESVKIDGPNVG